MEPIERMKREFLGESPLYGYEKKKGEEREIGDIEKSRCGRVNMS